MSDLSKDFEKGLKKILAFDDEIIVFQTQIFKTCLFYNLSGQKVSKEILRILEKKFKNKTILLPSFSNDLAIKKKYDEILSIPNTGIIPTTALKSKKYFRTSSPLHSFLVKGPLVKEIKKLNPQTTWGTGSVFEWLEKKNARWVSLNLEWSSGCALHHRSEEICRVPYRFFKKYNGMYYINKKFIKRIVEKKYSYSLKKKPIFDYTKWPKFLKKKDTVNIFLNEGLKFRTSLARVIIKRSCEFFRRDPYGSVKNKKIFLKQKK